MTLAEAAAQAAELAASGAEQELATMRSQWEEEVEMTARSSDYRLRTTAYRAIGQFRYRQKFELLRRGLEDESPACRGTALLSLEQLSREHPAAVNNVRSLLHELVTNDPNEAVRRLAVVCLKNGSPQRESVMLLSSISEDDEQPRELREAAAKIAAALQKRINTKR